MSHVLWEVQAPVKTKHIQIAIFPLSPQVLNFLNPISAHDSHLRLIHKDQSSNPFSFASSSPCYCSSIPSNPVHSSRTVGLANSPHHPPTHHRHDNQDVRSPSTHLSCLLHPNTHIRNHHSLTHLLWFRICWWPIMAPIAVPSSLMTQSYIFVFLFCSRNQSIVMNITFDLFLFLPKSLYHPHPTCYLQNNAVLWKVPLQGHFCQPCPK